MKKITCFNQINYELTTETVNIIKNNQKCLGYSINHKNWNSSLNKSLSYLKMNSGRNLKIRINNTFITMLERFKKVKLR